jgi:hypothetical protein
MLRRILIGNELHHLDFCKWWVLVTLHSRYWQAFYVVSLLSFVNFSSLVLIFDWRNMHEELESSMMVGHGKCSLLWSKWIYNHCFPLISPLPLTIMSFQSPCMYRVLLLMSQMLMTKPGPDGSEGPIRQDKGCWLAPAFLVAFAYGGPRAWDQGCYFW